MTQKWDRRFVELAQLISTWSKDDSTKVGAVIVAPDKTIVSTGYNGFPRRMRDDAALYADRAQKLSRVIHAEMNALLFAYEPIGGCTLYTWPMMPCDRCFVHLAQAGIARCVYPRASIDALERWSESFARTLQYAAEMGIDMVELEV